jgi:hypothetical protein
MAKVKSVFFLPLRDNDGRTLQAEIDEAEFELYSTFVGFTCSGTVRGTYQMADRSKAEDTCLEYFVVLDETRLDELKDVLRRFKAKTTQEALYFEVVYNAVVDFI